MNWLFLNRTTPSVARVSLRKFVSAWRPVGRRRQIVASADGLDALYGSPGLDDRAVDAEVIGGEKPLHVRLIRQRGQGPGAMSPSSSRFRLTK